MTDSRISAGFGNLPDEHLSARLVERHCVSGQGVKGRAGTSAFVFSTQFSE